MNSLRHSRTLHARQSSHSGFYDTSIAVLDSILKVLTIQYPITVLHTVSPCYTLRIFSIYP